MIITNRFLSLNQDLAKTKLPNTACLDINNMRMITDQGLSTGSIQNVRGNTLDFTIPNTFAVYKIAVNTSGPYAAGTFTIGLQVASTTFTPTVNTTGQDIYNFIDGDPNLTQANSSYFIAVASNYVVLYSSTMNASTSFGGGSGLTISTLVPAQTNLIPIGFTTIRNNIYLFTTPTITDNPGGHDLNLTPDATGTGQIWKLTYNELSYVTAITLVYNGYLDFTVFHPVPTTATLGRYENSTIQKIYWTDFFAPLRSLNVADPNLMAINPDYININPPVKYSIPRLVEIKTGGSTTVGAYQVAYMLRNTGGAITNYSELSNPVFIVPEPESTSTGGANFKNYVGAIQGTSTNKSIEWLFEDLDTNFDIIDIIVIKRETITGNILVFKVAEEPIPSDGSLTFTYTGNEDIGQIEFDDFISLKSSFTHCKTIRQKDNRLFAANIRNQYADIDFDARAFRAKTSLGDDIYLTNNGFQSLFNSTTARASSQTSDAINDYTNANAGYYKPTTAILGGAGTNISYEFGTMAIKADSTLNISTTSTGSDYRHTNPEYSTSFIDLDVKRIDNLTDQTYSTNTINSDIKYAYYSGLLKGYPPSEIQRFGIQLYDKRKNPIFVKWIGDIKFPEISNSCPAANAIYEDGSASPTTTFIPSFIANKSGPNECFVNQIYIKFTVIIPAALTNIISGYTIVRVEREESDKTILGTGIIGQTYDDGGTLWLPSKQINNVGEGAYPYLNITDTGAGEYNPTRFTFDCPEFFLGGFPGYQSGDQLRIFARLNIPATITVTQTILDAGTERYDMHKYYEVDATYVASTNNFVINRAGTCDKFGNFSFSLGYTYNNYTRSTNNTSDSLGAETLCVELNSNLLHDTTYGCGSGNKKKLLAQYYRPRTNQFGGNTYSARSRNTYIACSHFRPIQESSVPTGISNTFLVFGGDTFAQIYDNQKAIKNWGQSPRGQYNAPAIGVDSANNDKSSVTMFFPCYSTHNTGLRSGSYVNHNLENDDGTGASGDETHDYNTVYSVENNIRKYYPKPTEFIVNEEFDNRVHYSEVKINGETSDSWGIFLPNNFYDVDGIYGPINGLELLNENMLFFQEKGVGYLMINPVSQVQDNTGMLVVLGKGDVIQKHDYINNTVGTRHQHSIIKSTKGIYFIDTQIKRLFRLSGEGLGSLSEVKGMSSWFEKHLKGDIILSDNPVLYNAKRVGICGGVDFRFNEVIYTLHDKYDYMDNGNRIDIIRSNTICFNETLESFTSFYSYTPYLYLYDTRFMSTFESARYAVTTPVLQQRCWVHSRLANYGQFYGTYFDSNIKFVVNQNPSQHKIFDNLHLQTEVTTTVNETETDTGYGSTAIHETFNKLRVYNDYQDTGNTTLTPNTNITRRNRYWKTYVPNDTVTSTYSSFKPRMRDFHATIDLGFTNNGNKRLICHDVLTECRLAGSPISTGN